ncbi:HWE histidine kinase domain-containing protein [Rhizobium sp. RU36D]|uniref:HWE histidine kinase domain-containing protein n=1 Tax=Rhizobium sp. RU36D TaxID=1907415 RepID=UPI000A027FFB|nr:HWE histidine kinase domain-containing protein [Rhizobium sp. RU36D]
MHGLLINLPAFRAMRSPPSGAAVALSYLYSLAIFAIALVSRLWLDPYMLAGFPYVTFFPAVVITGFVFGVRQGILVAFLSFFASWYYFIPPYHSLEPTFGALLAMSLYLFVVITDLLLIFLVMKAYRAESEARAENQRMADEREVMARELDHRLKNIFAAMNAVINLSVKHASSPEDLAKGLRERLSAMGRSNLLLRGLGEDEEATLEAVIVQALEPFGLVGTARLSLEGPKTAVSGQAVIILSLILHELGTNAAKYGALSVPDGTVSVRWSWEDQQNEEPAIRIAWTERGGPPPAAPQGMNQGFGSTLLTRLLATAQGRSVSEFPSEGAEVTLYLPLSSLNPGIK